MLLINKNYEPREVLEEKYAEVFSLASAKRAQQFLEATKKNVPTPLHALAAMAEELGVARIDIKDEDHRLGLHSFKASGGAYAVVLMVLETAGQLLGRKINFNGMYSGEVREIAGNMTFSCASAGNHGRSVAAGAKLVGAKSVIFVHESVSEKRRNAMRSFGATIIEVKGSYDDSVAEATRVSKAKDWMVISDTSWPGYEVIPERVMQGYTAMIQEALSEMHQRPTHVFVQAGVGGLAAAVAAHLKVVFGELSPKIIVVEPARAACFFESAKAGKSIRIETGEPTVMAMLECYEPSLVAWRILSALATAFVTVADEEAIAAMNKLARPTADDAAVVAGESGASGTAGLIHVCKNKDYRMALDINADSRIWLINTEGATDEILYSQFVGLRPDEVYSVNTRH